MFYIKYSIKVQFLKFFDGFLLQKMKIIEQKCMNMLSVLFRYLQRTASLKYFNATVLLFYWFYYICNNIAIINAIPNDQTNKNYPGIYAGIRAF